METTNWYVFLLHTARGRMLLLTGLMIVFLIALHLYRRALEHSYSRLARALLVLGGILVIAVLLDLFGLLDVLVRE